MIDKIQQKSYSDHISNFNRVLSNTQWSDQYRLTIQMIEPTKKAKIPEELVQSFSFSYKNFSTDPVEIGSQERAIFDVPANTSLDVVLYNVADFSFVESEPMFFEYLMYKRKKYSENEIDYNDSMEDILGHNIQDYLLLDGKGKKIVPEDGSYLLPTEYYFRITGYALDANWTSKELFSGDYILDGNIKVDFQADGGKIQDIVLSFKSINFIKTDVNEIEINKIVEGGFLDALGIL